MSYDLYFNSRDAWPAKQEFVSHFTSRRWYTLNGSQAFYANEDTGVYFLFELGDGSTEESEEEKAPRWASFNLNYFRPHVFAREALPEVEAFVEAFDLLIDDPQIEGMGQGEFSPEEFLRGWTSGNYFAVHAILKNQRDHNPLTLPERMLNRVWQWNFGRASRQEELGESVFAPRIMFLTSEVGARSYCAWPDAIPILLPRTDLIVVGRTELAPKRWFRRASDMALIPWSLVEPLLASFPRREEALEYYLLDYAAPPDQLVQFVRSLSATPQLPNGLTTDEILDQELVERAKSTLESEA